MPRVQLRMGDRVRIVSETYGWGQVQAGDIGTIAAIFGDEIEIQLPGHYGTWSATREDVELIKVTADRRKAAKITPTTKREEVAVRLIKRVTKAGFTAVKVESEGRLNRHDVCSDDCSLRLNSVPHDGCKRFSDVKVANDFILKHLAKVGLAKKCKHGENAWGYLYKPVTPLMFSKVYTDSETEWTTTLLLKRAEDVLFVPHLVDAFNALATANGNGIDVQGSGMHTAFIEGEKGVYPSERPTAAKLKLFNNFAKSMRPLLPALYFLGANRIDSDGNAITRSTSPRQPKISADDKYSAVAYRYGALEFRVFDTCYDNRDQLLDNIVVMAQGVSKYWKEKYVKPAVKMTGQVYFGTSECCNSYVNRLSSLYVVRDHIVLLNKGLRCLKQPYYTVKEVKQQRHFNVTVRHIKEVLNTDAVRSSYERHLQQLEAARIIQEASEYYSRVRELEYRSVPNVAAEVKRIRRRIATAFKKRFTPEPIECFAYKEQYGTSFPLLEEV